MEMEHFQGGYINIKIQNDIYGMMACVHKEEWGNKKIYFYICL